MNESATTEWEDWVQVGRFPSLDEAYDHGLVILAMGEACRVAEASVAGEFELHAEARPAPKILAELDAYGREISPRHGHEHGSRAEAPSHAAGAWWCALWLASLLAVFYWQTQDPSLVRRAASSSIGFFDKGEWWRPASALFLHADFAHLLGNMLSGAFFATWVAKSIGPLRAWALILSCGALGNLLTSWVAYPETFTSIGASTAVFAALGILSGIGAAESLRDRARLPWLKVLAPPLGGIILLGWLGGGNSSGNTDVLGHVLGFSVGLPAGWVAGVLDARRAERDAS
jgi:membrane associated rhomboid family serine protease